MASVTIEEAQSKLPELVDNLAPGEEVLITRNQQPVARLIGGAGLPKRRLGTMRGTVTYIAQDFDAPLEDFKEYMQ